MTEKVTLAAERREQTGKGAARQLRLHGKIPAVIYGHGRNAEPLVLNALDFGKTMQSVAGGSTVIELTVDGKKAVRTLIRELQRHPTKLDVTHVDFYEIRAGEKITVDVRINLEGVPLGVRTTGGVLEQFLREVQIEVLPKHIPERVDLDVNDLTIGHSMHVSDLEIPNAEILTDSQSTICTVVPPRVEEVAPVEPVEEEEAVEPELIRKPKEEGEEETEGAEAEE